ncbi:hypothetical protein OROMI_029582 [Orobanche minor]
MDFPVSCKPLIIMMSMTMAMLPNSAYAQSNPGIPLNVALVAGNAYSTWISPSGDFAFGFRQVSPSPVYLLAIMFDKMPETEKTIVWSANGDHPVEQGSRVQLYDNGRYELRDTRGYTIWSANVIGSGGVDYGAMLDNGNFVLKRNNSVVWQSFDEPTDTLLPGQVFNQNGSLFARFSETIFAKGRYKFILQTDGSLVLYTLYYPIAHYMVAYWYTQTINTGYQVIFSQSGNVHLTARNGTILNRISSSGVPVSKFYQRLTLDCDGVLRQYVFPKSNKSTGGRPMRWSVDDYTPTDICLRVGGTRGRGVCGSNSLCTSEVIEGLIVGVGMGALCGEGTKR